MQTTLVCVGGFLGAGKTALLLAAAGRLRAAGRRVGVITNDQGGELVDTHVFRASGFETEEIAGGCFCCRFSDFVRAAGRLRPEIILAEPVGSCTDLAATLLRPLRRLYGDRFRIAPLTVLVDPSQPLDWLGEQQLTEADLVWHSKADLYPGPGKRLSAHTGQGVEAWLAEVLDHEGEAGGMRLDLDYVRYAEAEAALGWRNWRGDVTLPRPLTPAAVAGPLLAEMESALSASAISIAHLKVYVQAATGYVKAGVCRNGDEPSIEGMLDAPPARRHRVVLNLRALAPPEALAAIPIHLPGRVTVRHEECFRPGPPRPEHRESV